MEHKQNNKKPFLNEKVLWSISIGVSVLLVLILIYCWGLMNKYEIHSHQLTNKSDIDKYLSDNWEQKDAKDAVLIKTGIFIQSLEFFNATNVNISGYIWQKYEDGIHDSVKPAEGEIGYIFPEQVNSGSDIEPREVYRDHHDGIEVIGWYFEATLRQPFDYSNYPFDNKTVWIRLWAADFAGNVVLTPDFGSYSSTTVEDIFGIEEEIVLGTWTRENTYFNYRLSSYNTNFGLNDYVGQTKFPELHYNFIIKRDFKNAFIAHLLPIFLIAALLFAALLTITSNKDKVEQHGFNTTAVIGSSSALFFVVLLAHIELRQQFASSGIVYMEYFYFLMYFLITSISANTYMFSNEKMKVLKVIHYNDNIIPKLLFWPTMLFVMLLITIMFL